MKAIIRKDEEAVSPVIATILMVAITVVLAAVLYVMVSGLITSPGSTPKQIGISVTSSGGNWILTMTSVPAGMTAGTTYLSITDNAGVANLTATLLSALGTGSNGIKYQPASGTVGTTTALSPGDSILINSTIWASGHRVQLTNSGTIVYGPTTLQ